ncbi:MAG TPA: hypothetical protein VIP48_05675 [Streptosporangiaceae bacterium]
MADIDVTPARARPLRCGLATALGAMALAAGLLTAFPGLAAAVTGVTLTVARSGAEYTSVQAAVNAVPVNPTVPYTILIGPGTRSLQYPIDLDPFYDPATGTSDPYFKDVLIDGATETNSVPGAESVLEGFSPAYPLGLTLRDVHFDVTATSAQDANIAEIDSNLVISGPGVTVTRAG